MKKSDDFDFGLSVDEAVRTHKDFTDGRDLELGNHTAALAERIEARLNRAPLTEELMGPWLERLIGHPVVYAPLPAFV